MECAIQWEVVRIDPQVAAALRAELAAGLAASWNTATPTTKGRLLAGAITERIDRVVVEVAQAAVGEVAKGGPEAQQRARTVSVVAVGGYGRAELCPHSDVDLLFVLPEGAGELHDAGFVDAVLYGLWDLGLEVGHAVRTLEQCRAVAKDDQSVLSALLDARHVWGPSAPVETMTADLAAELADEARWRAYVVDKLAEAVKRRQKFGTTVFLLEPNVKESEGGLRDLHSAMWIARARFGARRPGDLVELGVLSSGEASSLDRAYDFLLRIRIELHALAKRRQDVLGFQLQEQVAARLGYLDLADPDLDKRGHGVERLMRAYYFHARNLRHVSALIVERALHEEGTSDLGQQLRPGGFRLEGGTLTVDGVDQFERDPAALVRIFRIAQEEALPIYSYTKNLIAESRGRIDKSVRRDPAVVRDFLALLEDPKADGAILDDMHDLGVLRRLIPEVSRITARWQHSNYHVYTVDAHSLFVVKCLKALKQGAFADEHRALTALMADLVRPQVLYLAGFLHDVGKGWARGDHSLRGALVGAEVGARFEAAGLPSWGKSETEDLVWLIKEHLTLSDSSQRRDVTDPDLIAALAKDARTVERLTMLHLLTFADMKSTSPKVWTDWKGRLLEELYHQVEAVLRQGRADAEPLLALRRAQVRSDLSAEIQGRGRQVSEPLLRSFIDALPVRYLVGFRPRQMVRHFDMWVDVSRHGGIALHVRHLHREGASRLTLVSGDRPGLLALLAGTLAAHRLQVLSAQIFSIDLLPQGSAHALSAFASRGHDLLGAHGPSGVRAAIDVLYLKDESGRIADDPSRWASIREDLERVIMGRAEVSQLVESRLPRSGLRARAAPRVKTEIRVANGDSKGETVIDVFGQDRLGVLYRITDALTRAGLSISLAKISTQGDRVADGFYVTDSATGKKIEDPARIEAIQKALVAALEAP